MSVDAYALTRLAHRELVARVMARHTPSQFDPEQIMLSGELRLIGTFSKSRCNHDWQPEQVPERRWHCSQSYGDIVIGARTVYYCQICGASQSYLRCMAKDYPDLFPYRDGKDRWHLPTLWPRILKRWLASKVQNLWSNQSHDAQVVAV